MAVGTGTYQEEYMGYLFAIKQWLWFVNTGYEFNVLVNNVAMIATIWYRSTSLQITKYVIEQNISRSAII
jgi:hypothetical protein